MTERANRTDAGQTVLLNYNATSGTTTNGSAYAILPPSWVGNEISVDLYNIYENRCWNLNPEFNGPDYGGVSNNISVVFNYDTNQIAGLRIQNGSDKIFYMPFVFGKITNATNDFDSTSIKDEILNRTLNWMGLDTSASVLIIDDDREKDGRTDSADNPYEWYYETSLTNLGFPGPNVDTHEAPPPPNPPAFPGYDLIIWETGVEWQSIEDPSYYQDDVIAYLNQAGAQNLIVSGEDVGYCLDEDDADYGSSDVVGSHFYNNFLMSNFVYDDANTDVVLGTTGDPIGDNLSFFINGTGTWFYPDVIMPHIQNDDTLIYNWTSDEFGNQNNDDWYHRLEKNGHGTNDDCALLFIEDENDDGYDTGDKVWIEQELYVDRSELVWAGINFDYWAYNTWAPFTGNFRIYISINDTIMYSKSLTTISAHRQWFNTGMIPINISAIPLPNINIKIGLEVVYGSNYHPDMKSTVMIDNFKLYLQTKVTPSQINLKMDGIDVEGGLGYGLCNLTPSNPWTNSPVQVNFSWNPTPTPDPDLDIEVSFKCDTNLFASKIGQTLYTADPTKYGLLLDVDQGINTSWSFQYYVTLPNGYWNHSFTIFHPTDWNVTFVSEPQLPAVNRIGDCVKGLDNITIPATSITTSPDGYWRFEATSLNYLQDIQPQVYNGTHWINSGDFFVTNLTRITSYISNATGPPPNLASSTINLTILDPNGQPWYTTTSATYSNGWAIFPNLTIFGSNTTAGQHAVSVSWNSGVEGGYGDSSFNIVHNSELVLAKPTDAIADQTTEVNFGELFLIRIGLNDTDRNELAKGIDVTLNWTQGGGPVQMNLTDLETGQYEIVLDTSDLPTIDNYTIIINSYSPYFTNATYTLNLIVTTETLLSSPQFPKVLSEWGENITIQVNYQRALDEVGLNNSVVLVNWTLGPHTIVEIGNGQYDIEIDLSYAEITEYTLVINATKPNSAYKELNLKLEVKLIDTELTSPDYPRVIVEWGNNVTLSINYRTLTGLTGINNSIISLNWTQNYYNIAELGNGIYQIELNTSWCNIRDYILMINASKLYHQNRTLFITVRINAIETELISPDYPRVIGEWGNNITFSINYRTLIGLTGIETAQISINWTQNYYTIIDSGSGIYQIELNTSWCNIQDYQLIINASKSKHTNATISITIEVDSIETELISPDYPRVIGEWGSNLTLTANFRTIPGLIGIDNSLITINWTPGYYSIIEMGSGLYQIELNTSWCNLQDYLLEISASKTKHENKTIFITIEINAIETELISPNYPRVIGEWNTNITITLEYRTINPHGINNSVISINWTQNYYSISEIGNGYYQIELNTSWCDTQEYLLEINASKQYHQNKTLRITNDIIPFETELISDNYPRTIEEWNSNITIEVTYRTVTGLQGIPGATITANWTLGYYTIIEIGSGIYQIELNTSWSSIGEYILEINASKQYYLAKTLSIKIDITSIAAELVSPNYPRAIGEWNTNLTIELTYRTVEGLQGIPGGTLVINWTSGYYTIIEVGSGVYQIELNTSWCSIQEYILEINISQLNHEAKSLSITIDVTTIATELVSPDYPRAIVEWGFNLTIELTYQTVNGLMGIPGAIIDLNCTPGYYNILEIGSGVYHIELNSSCYPPGEYLLEMNASKQNHQNRTLRITIQIDPVKTDLVSDQYPRVIAEWNFNVSMIVNYRAVSGAQGILNAFISINWSLSAFTTLELGNGLYQIELNTSIVPGEYLLEINTSRQFHENKTILIIVQVNSVEAELVSNAYPRVVIEWGKNITIEVNYRTASGHYGINNSLITVNWTLGYFSISSSGSGLYQIECNTSWCDIREYVIEINASRLYHSNRTIRIVVQINVVETVLIYQSIESIPYGQNATIYLKYTDLTGNPIPSESDGSDILTINNTHWVSYNASNEYSLSIVVASTGLNQSDLLNITASKSKYKPQSILVFLTYRPIFTSFTNLNNTIISLPVEESTFILVIYNDTDFNQGISGANLTFYGYNNISFTDLGSGNYRININGTSIADAYSILVTIKKFGYVENSIQFVVQVKEWTDFTTYTFSSPVETRPVGSSATFSVLLEDDFTGTTFENISVFYVWEFGTGNLTYIGNGNYSFTLDTTGKTPGTYIITINATKDDHLLMSETVRLVITSGEVPWWVQFSWIFGILGAILAIGTGYIARNRWRQRHWEKKVKHIYVLTKVGIPLYDKRLAGIEAVDPSLVTSALIGISSIVQEIVHSKRVLKTIDHMDNKILFQHGFHIIVAILASVDLPVIRRKLAQFTNRFEYHYQKDLSEWKGDVDAFFGTSKIINEFFPIEEYIKDKEISAEWALENLFSVYGLPGIVTLLALELGLKEPKKITAGTGVAEKKIPIILRTLQDLLLIDSQKTLTKKGKNAIALYKKRKERYIRILRMSKEKEMN